ncbi:phosphopantetheine-binding protein [Methylocystis sp. WRRC1]|uniref:phosphopantetheine-binding protein n=1 Tax=unclassified Methylocystis TaxID=2625913 RepID=UPI0001F88212|nr:MULTISPECIES: phosphopantetheine-binding protein [unclassified Methylocystis]MCC3247078.1 phosphopantetheine-binding protein [Methylocystis sp. WRRC1]
MFETIRRLIDREARLAIPASDLTPRANLYELGLTPYTAIRLLLAVEREFGVEFPRESLNRAAMASIEAIARCVREAKFAPVAYEEDLRVAA